MKNNVYPCKPKFHYIKGGQSYIGMFRDGWFCHWVANINVSEDIKKMPQSQSSPTQRH